MPQVPLQAPGADVYQDLLRDPRGLRREQAHARQQWFSGLGLEKKDDLLFELEILLKGLACFANPRNHAGPPRRVAVGAQDFREPLVLAREGMVRVVAIARALLGERERTFVFHRYLETLATDDGARTQLARGVSQRDTPEEALFSLRHAFANLVEVVGGVSRLPRVPFRLFYATLSIAHREVSESPFFAPLAALEFRPELDRISSGPLLDLTRSVSGERARRLVALTFLSLFRMLRYLTLLEQIAERDPRGGVGLTHITLGVLRSDGRALMSFLQKSAGEQLAESFDREVFAVPAGEIAARYDALMAEAHRLVDIKATLGGVAANLRLELRRAFEHDVPAPDAGSGETLRAATQRMIANLRPALQNAVLVLGKSLGAKLDDQGVFDEAGERRAISERLRRDVWMFAQIVRAFAAKARAVPSRDDRWSGPSSLQFVREFLVYFDRMGAPLLRVADYPRFDAFHRAIAALEEVDLLDPTRLAHATDEATHFYEFLTALFTQIGQREHLRGIPFDRKAAAESLKLYLGE